MAKYKTTRSIREYKRDWKRREYREQQLQSILDVEVENEISKQNNEKE